MPVDDNLFQINAEKTLEALMEQIDDVLGDSMDVDLADGILTIELENGSQYVINKQAPNKEIWLSSPVSGAKHFAFDIESINWIDTRGGDGLYDLLSQELTQASGQPFSLTR
jgi:frataxin